MSIISVMMMVAFAIIYSITYNTIRSENKNKLLSIPKAQIESYAQEGMTSGIKVMRTIPYDYSLSFTIEVNKDGDILNIFSFIDMPEENYEKIAKIAWNNKLKNSIINLNSKTWQYDISSAPGNLIINKNGTQSIINNRYSMIFLDITDSRNTLRNLLITFLIVGLLMLFVIFIISLYFANRAIRPIAEAWDKQRQFVADASHELKTPLAIINANSDALLANEEELVKAQKKWIYYIKDEISRMTKLINDLLYLAKTEDSNIKISSSPFDISQVVNNVILSMEAIIYEKDIYLSHKIEKNIIIKGDLDKVKQVIIILLDNAIKYTDKKGSIKIELKKIKHQMIFSIENTGIGIKKQDLLKIFDRFYRTDPSRAKESGGYGLGLSVAKAIIDRMEGKIYASSIESKSTTFTFILESP